MTHLFGKQARKSWLIFLALIPVFSVFSADLTGPEIMEKARDTIRAQSLAVSGQLRTGPLKVPFQFVQGGGVTSYTFVNPLETIVVSMGENGVKIGGVKDSGKAVRGSILTYDDLALRFLYWPKIELLGTEKILSLTCWKLRLDAPNRQSPYAFVKLWVNRQSGAFLRAQTFDWSGQLKKQFEVISTQMIDGHYFLKQMRIQNQRPTDPNAETITYLEINRP